MKTVGILGGGQLGLLLSQSLSRLGAKVAIYDSDSEAPALRHTALGFNYSFADLDKLKSFDDKCDVITYEFEHLPADALATITPGKLKPGLTALKVAQDRLLEKQFLKDNGLPVADFAQISGDNFVSQIDDFGYPCILKTIRGGYDGKGQYRLADHAALTPLVKTIETKLSDGQVLVVERLIDLDCEVSCITARTADDCVLMPIFQNVHADSILDTTVYPASISSEHAKIVRDVTRSIATALDLEGILTVEFFIDKDQSRGQSGVMVNELAPRPHNSGHLSTRAFNLSQYDLLARVLLDMPLIEPESISQDSFAMANIMGDLYFAGDKLLGLDLDGLEGASGYVDLILYGKSEPRKKRKMGHLIASGADAAQSLSNARHLRQCLSYDK